MVSCVRDVEIDLEDLPDRIVLNASVCPGKEVSASSIITRKSGRLRRSVSWVPPLAVISPGMPQYSG